MVKRLFFDLVPGILSLSFVVSLAMAPSPHLEFVEDFHRHWTSLVVWGPVVLTVIPTVLAIYFRSARLTWYSVFILLLYGYLCHDSLGLQFIIGDTPIRIFRHSLLVLPYLIPVQFMIIHYVGTVDLLSPEGLLVFLSFLGEFAALLVISGVFGEGLVSVFSGVNSWSIPVTAGLEVPAGLSALVLGVALVVWFIRERSYYQHGSVVLFWMVFVTTAPFVRGLEWYLVGDEPLHFILSLSTAGVLLTGWTLNYAWSKAYRDNLTQIRGRLALDERLNRLTGQYTIVMIDIDEFKSFNDKYGHDSGDKVLQQVAECLDTGASGDVYRFGGEEFTIVYNGVHTEDVKEELEVLRKRISNNKVKVTRKSERATKVLEKRVTVSLGMAEPTKSLDTPERVLNAADESLFKAKDEGRNCLVVSGG